jgi:hypothetical protein
MTSSLHSLVRSELGRAVPDAVLALVRRVRQQHENVRAVLAYGSALRDSAPAETLVDLYVLTESASDVSANPLSWLACRLVPPNVYYAEAFLDGQVYRAKCAVLSLSQLEAKVRPRSSNPYFWARFAQPMRLAWAANDHVKKRVFGVTQTACATAWSNAVTTTPGAAPAEQWRALFSETYRTELRPETAGRAAAIVDANRAYYEGLSASLAKTPGASTNWPLRRFAGKLLSILRLAKAAFTFQGGADYIAWKIRRHSGVDIEVTDFHRRHPLLAGLILLPQLLRKGAIR